MLNADEMIDRGDWQGLCAALESDGPLLDWRDKFGQSLVGRVARYADAADFLRALLARGADPNHLDRTGMSPLGSAIDGRHSRDEAAIENARVLIDAGADPDLPAANEYPALHWAVHEGKSAFVRLFLDAGADPFIKGPYGQDAIEIAEERQLSPIVELLRRHRRSKDGVS